VARARLEFDTPADLSACLAAISADVAAGRVRVVRVRRLGLCPEDGDSDVFGGAGCFDTAVTAGFRVWREAKSNS
jgi:hypothetical protein